MTFFHQSVIPFCCLQLFTEAVMMFVFCGSYIPPTITITKEFFGISYITDTRWKYSGFNLTYAQISNGKIISLDQNNLKRDPSDIQHPKFENSRLGLIVHEMIADETSLTPSATLFPNKSVEPYSPKGPGYVKITTKVFFAVSLVRISRSIFFISFILLRVSKQAFLVCSFIFFHPYK